MPQQIDRTVRRAGDRTPRTTKVVDALLDADAKFRAVYSAQVIVLANGQHVYLVSNAEDVAAGRTSHEFVDILVPIVDTNRLDVMVAKVIELGRGSKTTTAALSRALAEVAAVAAVEQTIVAPAMPDGTIVIDPHTESGVRYVRLTNGVEYRVEIRSASTNGSKRYHVTPLDADDYVVVVYDPHTTFDGHVACVEHNTDACSHADAVRAYRIALAAERGDVADPENKR